jgi:hypothetical protein
MGLFDEEISQLTPSPEAKPSGGGGLFGDVDLPYEGPFQDRVDKMNPELWDKFTQMALDYKQATGEKLRYTDTFRTNAEQADLYSRKPGLAAPPGKSNHEHGNAIDVDNSQIPAVEKLGLLEKHGFTRPVLHKGETWHIELGGPVAKARSFLHKKLADIPMISAAPEAFAGVEPPLPAAPPVPPAPTFEKPVEPTSWKDIQDPFASTIALAMQHPEESLDPFAKGFAEGAGWGLVPGMGEHQRALGIIPTNMYTFGHDVGMILPVMLSLGAVGPAATALGAAGGKFVAPEILTPFARSVLGGAFFGAGERTNELVTDSISGKPTPSTVQGWGEIMGSAYNNALGFALAHSGVEATFGELGHYLNLRNFKKAFKEPLVNAAGGPEALQMAAVKDPSLSTIAEKSPEAAQAVKQLNEAAQGMFDTEIGALHKRVGRNLAEAEMFDQAQGLPREPAPVEAAPVEAAPLPEAPPLPPSRVAEAKAALDAFDATSPERKTPEWVAQRKQLNKEYLDAVDESLATSAPTTSAQAIEDGLKKELLDVVAEVPATSEPEIAFTDAISKELSINSDTAEKLFVQALEEGTIRLQKQPDGLIKAVSGAKIEPTAVEIKHPELPDGLAPKAVVEQDGTNWNQAGIYTGPEGVRHEFYVVDDPQTEGGFRFVEKIIKGDVPLKTSTLISGDVADISRYMENAAHMKWQQAYKFKLGEAGGTILYSGIPLDQFIPALKKLAPARQMELMKNIWQELKMSFAPEAMSKEGQIAAQGIREYHARVHQGMGQRDLAWEVYRKDFEKMTPEERQAFIEGPLREYETGGKVDPAYKPMLQAYKEATDKMIAAIEETTGKSFPYREYYFRHMWDDDPNVVRAAVDFYEAQLKNGYYDPAEIREMVDSMRVGQPAPSTEALGAYAGKRSLEGPKSFLKKRTIPTMADGISWGLKSLSDNPVDIVLADLMQKHRYLLGQRFFKKLKDEGLVKNSQTSDIPPDWQLIDDKMAQVWYHIDRPGGAMIPEGEERPMGGGPERSGYTEVPAVNGLMQGGKYYAPPEVAKIVNRDLSPGWRGSKIYQMYRTPTDMLNSIAVAWSGFHWLFETLSDMSIGSGRGLVRAASSIAKGDIAGAARGLKDFAVNTPFALPYKVLDNMRLGGAIRKGIYAEDPTALNPRVAEMADFAMRAGGRGGSNKPLVDSLSESLSNAWKDALSLRPLKTAKDLTELVAKPLMEWYVPRVKLSSFSRLLEGDLETAASKIGRPLSDTEQNLIAMNTWQHVDNIFGQLVYDNLHVSKAFRDAAFMFIRFPGWNIGSVRSLVGTGRGLVKAATGQKVDYQAKVAMEYALGLGLNLSILGTLTNYALTGEFPKDGSDIIMPRTGRNLPDGTPERVWYPSYLRDFMGFVHEPMKEVMKGNPLGAPGKIMATITAKEAPGVRLLYEAITNKNYFGEQIFTSGEGIGSQTADFAKHFGKEYLIPFGPQQAMKARGGVSAAANIAGVTSVPRRYLRTPAQEVISDYNALKRGTETQSEAEKSQFKRDFLDAVRSGDMETARGVAKEAVEALRFSPSDLGKLMKEARQNPLVSSFRGLPLEWALKAYKVADDEERKVLGKSMAHKIQASSLVEKKRLIGEIRSIYQDIQAKKETPRKVTWD